MCGPKKTFEGRYILSEFDEGTGQVLGANSKKFIVHCRYLVRNKIPVSASEWSNGKITLILVLSQIVTRN